MDDHLRQLGAQPILPMGEGDELSGQEESFLEWARNAFKVKLVTNSHFLDYFALILEKNWFNLGFGYSSAFLWLLLFSSTNFFSC